MAKKYLQINNSPESDFLLGLFESIFLKSRKGKNKLNKSKFAKLASSLNYAFKQNITEKSAEEYLKRNKHILYTAQPYWDILKLPSHQLETIFRKMASCELYIYERYKTGNRFYPDVFEIFEDKRNINKLKFNNVLTIYVNGYLRKQTREQILELIPKNPKDEFPEVRKIKRHFILHIGLTNTGKTYNALLALKKSKSGAYLSPLRLLALEVQERLNEDGIPCSLLTGEEEDILKDAMHISSTVEKADYKNDYDCVVIDECQLIQDQSRGSWWTKAILGMKSKEIHLCAAPEAVEILLKIIKDCDDSFEVREYKRDTELVFSKTPFTFRKIDKGDALVVFSRKSVLNVAQELNARGIKTSIIYGALPYKTRKEQLKLFTQGKTDVVVATDAIGMGLNLPIKRIVFLESEKFDGTETRPLLPWEVKQIAGRAGRKGIYDKGFVSIAFKEPNFEEKLRLANEPLKYAYLGFSDVLLDIDCDLIETLKIWKSIATGGFYVKQDIDRTLNLCEKVMRIYDGFDKKELLKLASIPFDEDNKTVSALFNEYVLLYSYSQSIFKPELEYESLYDLEDYYKCLDLYYSFSKNMGYEPDLLWLKEMKAEIAEKINKLLLDQGLAKKRRCTMCNRTLQKNYHMDICRNCLNDLKYLDFEEA